MNTIKAGMVFILCLFAVVGKSDDKETVRNALNFLSNLVASKYQLSTTGYQSSMRNTSTNLIVPERRAEYTAKAKEVYPSSTLLNLGELQSKYINCIPGEEKDFLSAPHSMNEVQLTSCLGKVREKNFANCDMQAFEVAIHIYALGFKDFVVISNKKLSHNYVVLRPTNLFPNGAIIDSWTGRHFIELNFANKKLFSHFDANIEIVPNMMSWLKNNATKSANYAWILDIRKRFFLRQDALPLKQLLKPTK